MTRPDRTGSPEGALRVTAGVGVTTRVRTFAFHSCVAGAILFLALPMAPFLVIPVAWPWLAEQLGVHRFHDVGVATLLWLILIGLLMQWRRPERQVGAMQQAVAVTIVLLAGTAIARPATLLSPLLLPFSLTYLAAALHPARRDVVRFRWPPELRSALLVLVAAGPLAMYAQGQIRLDSSNLPVVAHGGHWTTMASLAVALLIVATFAAGRPRGWRVPATSAGTAGVVVGVASIAMPQQASAMEPLWSALLVAWGASLLLLSWRAAD